MEEVLADKDIDIAWANANFGRRPKRIIIFQALIQFIQGYETGHTIEKICKELKLINDNKFLTKLGVQFLLNHKGITIY